jgi:hypothetical protein
LKSIWILLAATLCRSLFAQECCDGLPNVSARYKPECRTLDGFANLIVWTANESGADAWAEVLTTLGSSSTLDFAQIDFQWEPGFRVGFGYGMNLDQWDTQAYYTWFQTRGKESAAGLPGTIHSSFVGNFYVSNPKGLGLSGPTYSFAKIDWTIRYNILDWELGRNFWVSHALALRPFVGIKGGWIHQSMDSTWENPTFIGAQFVNPELFSIGKEQVNNRFWGIGPSIGMNSKWSLYKNGSNRLHLFGDFSGALMWGHWTFHDAYSNDAGQRISVGMQNINSGAATIRTFMGFGWEGAYPEVLVSMRLGYETQFWLDQLQYYSFIGGRLSNALTLQGGTFEIAFDF